MKGLLGGSERFAEVLGRGPNLSNRFVPAQLRCPRGGPRIAPSQRLALEKVRLSHSTSFTIEMVSLQISTRQIWQIRPKTYILWCFSH
tara:strand:+ start:636 stop:899 length:264 start_codon:yes stop_codon:yes gene_type:complete